MRHGFLLIRKPVGPTSHDIVAIVRRTLPEPKVGHLGTLDPAAEGLLILAVGAKALKVVELFDDLSKEYEAEITFGAVSTTYDREGVLTDVAPLAGWSPPTIEELRRVLRDRFIGRTQQTPPAASAVHVGGERAYRKMMQGRSFNIPPREVHISKLDVLSYDYPKLRFRVACGSGTYIRSLAHDLGEALHCGGYLSALRRTTVGEWRLENAVLAERAVWTDVLPLKDVLKSKPGIELTDEEFEELKFGRPIEREVVPNTIGWHEGLPVVLLVPKGTVEPVAQPRKVF